MSGSWSCENQGKHLGQSLPCAALCLAAAMTDVRQGPLIATAAVHACSQKGDLECALTILEDLKKDGVKPDEVSVEA